MFICVPFPPAKFVDMRGREKSPTDESPGAPLRLAMVLFGWMRLEGSIPPEGGVGLWVFGLICHAGVVKWGVGNQSRERPLSRGRDRRIVEIERRL